MDQKNNLFQEYFSKYLQYMAYARNQEMETKQELQDEPLSITDIKMEHYHTEESVLQVEENPYFLPKYDSHDYESPEFEDMRQNLNHSFDNIVETTMEFIKRDNGEGMSFFLGEIKVETDSSDSDSMSFNLNVEDLITSICDSDTEDHPVDHPFGEFGPNSEQFQNTSNDSDSRKIQNEQPQQQQDNWSDSTFKTLYYNKNKSYQCNQCSFKTNDKKELNRHLVFSIVFGCKKVSSANKQNARAGSSSAGTTGSKFIQCVQCRYSTTSKKRLVQHFETHHNKESENRYHIIPSESLGHSGWRSFQLSSDSGIHKQNKRGRRKLRSDCSKQGSCSCEGMSHDVGGELYQCNQCNFRTRDRTTLNRHLVYSTVFSCKMLPDSGRNSAAGSNTFPNHQAEIFQCEQCKYTTRLKEDLIAHFKTNHKRKRGFYQCQKCGFETRDRFAHNRHVLLSIIFNCKQSPATEQELDTISKLHCDNKSKIFQCEKCSYTTETKQQLIEHIEKGHDGISDEIELWKCNRCNFETRNRIALNRHLVFSIIFNCEQSPENEQNDKRETFQCAKCKYKTKVKQRLIEHTKKKHENKSFKCKQCNFETTDRVVLDQHLVFSTIYGCELVPENRQNPDVTGSSNKATRFKSKEHRYTSKTKQQFVEHLNKRHDTKYNKKELWKCKHCNFETADRNVFNRHRVLSVVDSCKYPLGNNQELNKTPNSPSDNESEQFRCDNCSYTAKFKIQIEKHSCADGHQTPNTSQKSGVETLSRTNKNSYDVSIQSEQESKEYIGMQSEDSSQNGLDGVSYNEQESGECTEMQSEDSRQNNLANVSYNEQESEEYTEMQSEDSRQNDLADASYNEQEIEEYTEMQSEDRQNDWADVSYNGKETEEYMEMQNEDSRQNDLADVSYNEQKTEEYTEMQSEDGGQNDLADVSYNEKETEEYMEVQSEDSRQNDLADDSYNEQESEEYTAMQSEDRQNDLADVSYNEKETEEYMEMQSEDGGQNDLADVSDNEQKIEYIEMQSEDGGQNDLADVSDNEQESEEYTEMQSEDRRQNDLADVSNNDKQDWWQSYRNSLKNTETASKCHLVFSKVFNCTQCIYTTKIKKALIKHSRMKHKKSDNQANRHETIKGKHKERKRNTNVKHYTCYLCDFSTKLRGELMKHVKSSHNTNTKQYTCYLCDFSTKLKIELMKHIKSSHYSNVKHYTCYLCGFSNKLKIELMKHIKSSHNTKRHICYLCDFSTKVKRQLIKHINSSHNTKHYTCYVCDFTTKVKIKLMKHIKSTHNTKHYTCNLCDFSTKVKRELMEHIRSTHKNQIEMFKNKGGSENKHHARLHEEFSKTVLNGKHTERKQNTNIVKHFTCYSCSFSTKFRGELMKHIKSSHKNQIEMFKNKKGSENEQHARLHEEYSRTVVLEHDYSKTDDSEIGSVRQVRSEEC